MQLLNSFGTMNQSGYYNAYQNRKTNGNRWTGITPSGVKVEGWIKPKTTVYSSKNQ